VQSPWAFNGIYDRLIHGNRHRPPGNIGSWRISAGCDKGRWEFRDIGVPRCEADHIDMIGGSCMKLDYLLRAYFVVPGHPFQVRTIFATLDKRNLPGLGLWDLDSLDLFLQIFYTNL